MNNSAYAEYQSDYSNEGFWEKSISCVGKVCRQLLQEGLLLYYALQDSDTPYWAKSVILGALGYFISPMDISPDILPVIGYSDDLAVMVAALFTVRVHVKEEHRQKSKEVLDELLG